MPRPTLVVGFPSKASGDAKTPPVMAEDMLSR